MPGAVPGGAPHRGGRRHGGPRAGQRRTGSDPVLGAAVPHGGVRSLLHRQDHAGEEPAGGPVGPAADPLRGVGSGQEGVQRSAGADPFAYGLYLRCRWPIAAHQSAAPGRRYAHREPRRRRYAGADGFHRCRAPHPGGVQRPAAADLPPLWLGVRHGGLHRPGKALPNLCRCAGRGGGLCRPPRPLWA